MIAGDVTIMEAMIGLMHDCWSAVGSPKPVYSHRVEPEMAFSVLGKSNTGCNQGLNVTSMINLMHDCWKRGGAQA